MITIEPNIFFNNKITVKGNIFISGKLDLLKKQNNINVKNVSNFIINGNLYINTENVIVKDSFAYITTNEQKNDNKKIIIDDDVFISKDKLLQIIHLSSYHDIIWYSDIFYILLKKLKLEKIISKIKHI